MSYTFHLDKIKIQLASAERIREWSYGEVKKPETINYRTLKPERDGLFCEKIFGTTKDWECYCGKFKSIRYKGVVCDKCGVEVTHSKVRRERMGHIELSYSVAHIWYYRSVPSRIALVLDMTATDVKNILYFEKYVVIDPGETDLHPRQIITQEEYYQLYEQLGDKFYASIGADAIKELLALTNIENEIREIRLELESGKKITNTRLFKRLETLEAFRDSANRPEWMVLDVIPVLPPELRPMVQLDGGRFATSDLNDLYRRVINRNTRLKRLLTLKAPDIIVCNEKRMLQEAVDALFDNSRRKKVIKSKANRPLKSLSDLLKGKQGRFRQNLLGKRVDYSGRTVIVVGPNLKLYECGIPKKMALELFKPFIMKWLIDKEYAQNIKAAKTMIEKEEKEVFKGLETVIHEHPVLLNRAPTLHRLGIQAFLPVLIETKAIQLHPLVCHAFNADFDGDQMAIHVPLSPRAQLECWLLVLSVHNILNPANGTPIVMPTQDMILGLYYLTAELQGAKGTGKLFENFVEVYHAVENDIIDYRAKIQFIHKDKTIETTPGKLIFNNILPEGHPFINRPLTSKEVNELIANLYKSKGSLETVNFLDKIKKLGFEFATKFAPTISINDIKIPNIKKKLLDEGNKEVERIENEYRKGIITNDERSKKIIEEWVGINEKITDSLFDTLSEDQNGFNPVYVMAISGARGSKAQIRQLAGMRGLMAKPSGDIIELPIRSNFKEGLGILEFFISTHGARKGLADTALKTADAGYLTRRLVDISQDVIIRGVDCQTKGGISLKADKEGDKILVSLKNKIYGRYLAEDIVDTASNEVIFKQNTLVTDEIGDQIEKFGYEQVMVRSTLTCDIPIGVCSHCYGIDLSTLKPVEQGEAVGIIAAQSIGQPGTQLTMRTFHIGGTATKKSLENKATALFDCIILGIQGKIIINKNKQKVLYKRGSVILGPIQNRFVKQELNEFSLKTGDRVIRGEEIGKKLNENGQLVPVYSQSPGYIYEIDKEILILGQDYPIALDSGSIFLKEEKDILVSGDIIAEYDPFNSLILTGSSGRIELSQIEEGKNLKIEEVPGIEAKIMRIVNYKKEKLIPRVLIFDKGKLVEEVSIPIGALLQVNNADVIHAGDTVAKIETQAEKTKDITGGLPRVEELFEARHPKEACNLADIDGIINDTGRIVRDKRVIEILPDDASEEEIEDNKVTINIPIYKQLLVQSGEKIKKGDPLDEGALDPHEILRVLGEDAIQKYLTQEIQEVYRLQGVHINDKHIEVMLRQMMKKVEILNEGDTSFIPQSTIDKAILKSKNQQVVEEGGAPATYKPILMGLTKVSIHSESFLSAASFQETTKVLIDAAIKGKEDPLHGLKENIIIGHLMPAGTGMKEYNNIKSYKHVLGDLFYDDEEKKLLIEQGYLDEGLDESQLNNTHETNQLKTIESDTLTIA